MQATFLRRPCNVIGFSALHFAEDVDSSWKNNSKKCRLRSYQAEHAEVVSTDLDIKSLCSAIRHLNWTWKSGFCALIEWPLGKQSKHVFKLIIKSIKMRKFNLKFYDYFNIYGYGYWHNLKAKMNERETKIFFIRYLSLTARLVDEANSNSKEFFRKRTTKVFFANGEIGIFAIKFLMKQISLMHLVRVFRRFKTFL